jgi:hypothetical protein
LSCAKDSMPAGNSAALDAAWMSCLRFTVFLLNTVNLN